MEQPRRARTLTSLVAGLALVGGLAGCGSEPADGGRSTGPTEAGPRAPAAEGAWTRQVLAVEPGADNPDVVGVSGEDVVVAFTTEEGTLHAWAGSGEAELTAGDPLPTGLDYLKVPQAVRLGDRWLAVGSGGREGEPPDDDLAFEVGVWGSDDGRTWARLDATGIDGPADIEGLAATEGRVVATGTLRGAEDPSSGGFEAAIWSSADGTTWARADVPGVRPGDDSYVGDVVVLGDDLLAVGRAGDASRLWRSPDGGATWALVAADGLPAGTELGHLAVQGGDLVAGGTRPDPAADPEDEGSLRQVVLRSTDGGTTWAEAATAPPSEGEGYAPEVHGAAGRFFTERRAAVGGGEDPSVCYADIAQCTDSPVTTTWVSDDGDTWSPVDTSGIERPEYAEVGAWLGAANGPLLALVRTESGVDVWSWPAGVELPPGEAPKPPRTVELTTLGEEEEPEPGVRYAAPLYVHCGMDWLYLGGQVWQRTDDGPGLETGAGEGPVDGWPVAGQTIYGYATVVASEVLEYSIGDGEVIATYAPAAVDPPGCA